MPRPDGGAALSGRIDEWLAELRASPGVGAWMTSPGEPQRAGDGDTLREICQQPVTWEATAAGIAAALPGVRAFVAGAGVRAGVGTLLLTGSGSSCFVGECLAPGLQAALGVVVRAVPAGDFLSHPSAHLPPAATGPALLVSFARSGDSPESAAVVELFLRQAPHARHLVVTCNRQGALVRRFADDPRVHTIVLDEAVCDRSLVMTSSFTNMVLVGRALAGLDPRVFARTGQVLAARARKLLREHSGSLATVGARAMKRALVLGAGPHLGAAREGALKLVEMSAGRVLAVADTYLGVRHGPLSAVDDETLVLAYLSSETLARAYELDLLNELRRRRMGAATVIVGENPPAALGGPDVVFVDIRGEGAPVAPALEDADLVLLDVLVAQLVAFARCRALGLRPDAPSPDGVITRVVAAFPVHTR